MPPPRRGASGDPRTIITPDAFSVAPELLGLPLASPWRRLLALLLDLLFIAVLSRLGGVALGVTAALFFLLLSRREGSYTGMVRGVRILMGCLGVFIFGATVLAVVGISFLVREGRPPGVPQLPGGPVPGIMGALQGFGEVQSLRRAANPGEADSVAFLLAGRLERMGLAPDEIAEVVDEVAPDSAWAAGLGARVAGGRLAAGGTPGAEPPAPAEVAPEGEVPGHPPGDVAALAERYAALLAGGDTAGPGAEAYAEARAELLTALGGDTLDALEARLLRSEEERQAALSNLSELRRELRTAQEEPEGGPITRFLRGILEDLGVAFGFAALYLTFFTAWWKGQTPGKKLLGIRVRQLDGRPLSWWAAFERTGGYAAGLATGLLGFAQILWDPNRQAIHDRISSTVVVRDGREAVPGLWSKAVDTDPGRGVRLEFPDGDASTSRPAGPGGG